MLQAPKITDALEAQEIKKGERQPPGHEDIGAHGTRLANSYWERLRGGSVNPEKRRNDCPSAPSRILHNTADSFEGPGNSRLGTGAIWRLLVTTTVAENSVHAALPRAEAFAACTGT